jgi:hypothetical protein
MEITQVIPGESHLVFALPRICLCSTSVKSQNSFNSSTCTIYMCENTGIFYSLWPWHQLVEYQCLSKCIIKIWVAHPIPWIFIFKAHNPVVCQWRQSQQGTKQDWYNRLWTIVNTCKLCIVIPRVTALWLTVLPTYGHWIATIPRSCSSCFRVTTL